jgi:peptide/nickel transport system permease protein
LAFFWWPSFPRQGFSRLTGEDGLAENLRTTFLPALTVALSEIAVFTRLLRSDMISTLQEDYILAANAQGKPLWRILFRDALRPSSFSLMTVAGVSLGRLIGGTVIVETIFNLPGMGRLIIQEGVVVNDFPIVQGGVLVIALFYVILNALVDISYAALDPRIRRGVV